MTQHLSEKTFSNALLTDPAPTLAERAATRENDCPFIVRVLHSRDLRFLGTAFFVSPTLAIGCLHYLLIEKDPKGQLKGPVHTDLMLDLGDDQVKCSLVFKDAERDFVAIRIDEPPAELTTSTARFAENLDSTTLEKLCISGNLLLKGYLGREGGVAQHQVEIRDKPLGQTERTAGSLFRDAQFSGGLHEGFSGSPLLAKYNGEWLVLGMAYLGGEKSSHSRVLLADAILELLKSQCLDVEVQKPVSAQHLVDAITTRKFPQRAISVVGGLAILGLLAIVYFWQSESPASVSSSPALTDPSSQTPREKVALQTLGGIVRDNASDRPLAGVSVELPTFRQTTTTDEFGGFMFSVTAPGDHWIELTARKAGFEDAKLYLSVGSAQHDVPMTRK